MAQHTVVVEQAPSEEKKKRKKLPLILAGVGILALVPIVGSTFAASITLGSGSVEFGQGTQTAAACDSSIDVALGSSITSGAFKLQTITLSNLDATACAGKTFKVHVANGSDALQDWISSGTALGSFKIASSFSATLSSVTSGITAVLSDSTGTAYASAYDTTGKVVITVSTPYLSSGSVSKVLLETSN
jgi:hypothetical protein